MVKDATSTNAHRSRNKPNPEGSEVWAAQLLIRSSKLPQKVKAQNSFSPKTVGTFTAGLIAETNNREFSLSGLSSRTAEQIEPLTIPWLAVRRTLCAKDGLGIGLVGEAQSEGLWLMSESARILWPSSELVS